MVSFPHSELARALVDLVADPAEVRDPTALDLEVHRALQRRLTLLEFRALPDELRVAAAPPGSSFRLELVLDRGPDLVLSHL